MWGIEILLVSTLLAFAQGTNFSLFPKWQSSWIEGGSPAAPGEFPYMVSVKALKPVCSDYCGGSIVNSWYILTAAHCLLGATPPMVKILIGTNELYRGGKTLGVTHIIQHFDYDDVTHMNDIALLKIREPLFYNSLVQPVLLPNQGEKIAVGTSCVLTGWGQTCSSLTALPNNLQKMRFKTISNDECRKHYHFQIDTKICATAGPGKGIGKGDSGGPLICGGKQMGVLIGRKTSKSQSHSLFPTTYIYVPKYVDWIRRNAM